jgi:translation initiation factor IF-2
LTSENHNNNKNENSFSNIKQLSSFLQQSGEFSELVSNIRTLKKDIDALLSKQMSIVKIRADEEARRQEAERPAPPPPPEKKIAVSIVEIEAAPEQPAKPKTEIDNETRIAQPKPTVKEEAPLKSYTPSYIRGEVIPPPPRPVVQRGGLQQKGKFPRSDGGMQRPFDRSSADGRPALRPFDKTGNRPMQNGRPPMPGAKPGMRPPYASSQAPFRPTKPSAPILPAGKERKPDKKKDYQRPDEKKALNKRTLIRKGFIAENFDEERMGSRKLKSKKAKIMPMAVAKKIEKATITTENLTVKILSEKIGITAQQIIKQLMLLGIMTTINSVVDFPTMELVASELGVEIELKLDKTKESLVEDMHDEADEEENLFKRPPIITVMGHVDHGKTSLLDAIRKTNVVSGEAGGITQHIGAYSVKCNGETITFLDTPGHEAFTQLRARGAKITDIAVLIVAADDGVMPQTIEAINHAKAAEVPILVAINKIDKPTADIEKIKQTLSGHGLVPEEWGGDTIMVPISAKRGDGIEKLLEMILFLAEYNNYRANPDRSAKGSVIEAKLDKGKGPVANIIIQNGTLRVGDFIVSGMTYGRVRAMVDDKGQNIKSAPPSTPVSILGFADVPNSGDTVYSVNDEKTAKQVIHERNTKMRTEQTYAVPKATLDDLMNKITEGQLKDLNIIVKGDVHGSVEALTASLLKIVNEEVKVNIVHGGVGAINKSDVMLADVAGGIIIGFNVKPDSESKQLAEKSGIEIRLYNIIYEAIGDVEKIVKGMLAPKYKETITGRAQVRNVFKITGVGQVAGSYVLSGKITRNAKAKVYRDGVVIHEGTIEGLKRFKDDAKEVSFGFECGISVSGMSDFKELDEVESILVEEIKN